MIPSDHSGTADKDRQQLARRSFLGPPSLAGLWGRNAGFLPSFERYSEALKSSGIV